jgi:sialate O-acetylesterase
LGGTTALTWIDEPYLNDMKELRHYLEAYRLCLKELDMDKYIEQNRQMREWMASDEMTAFQKKIANGHVTPLILFKAIRYQKKFSDTLNQMGPHYINRPSGLYHCMVQKIAGFTCAGVIWYQGESDEDKADIYELLLTSVIACWRNAWQDDFPFLFVQLAPFGRRLHLSGIRFPIIRRKQELVSKSVANAYMISIMDAGEKADIHPKNKRPVGERLALMAMGKVYGSPVQCESPELSVGTQSTGCIRLLFEHTGNGLELRGKRVCALQLKVNGKEIKSFYFSAAGREIEIRSNKIKPDSDCSVQFAQTGYCSVNIYNSTGLPVKPFTWYGSDIER